MRLVLLSLFLFILGGCAPKPSVAIPDKYITSNQLNAYSYDYLSQVAQSVREDSKKADDFSTFITVLKVSVNNYSSIIQSSAYLSNAVRFLPIPYAGEVSSFTKVFSGTLLHLNGAAMALDSYKKSSSEFLKSFDKLDKATATPEQLLNLSVYADTILMSDTRNLELSLKRISSSASALASTAQSCSNAVDTTGSYVNQAKNFVGFKSETKDQANIKESSHTLNARLSQFSQKIAALEHSGETYRSNISKARIYAELAQKISVN